MFHRLDVRIAEDESPHLALRIDARPIQEPSPDTHPQECTITQVAVLPEGKTVD